MNTVIRKKEEKRIVYENSHLINKILKNQSNINSKVLEKEFEYHMAQRRRIQRIKSNMIFGSLIIPEIEENENASKRTKSICKSVKRNVKIGGITERNDKTERCELDRKKKFIYQKLIL